MALCAAAGRTAMPNGSCRREIREAVKPEVESMFIKEGFIAFNSSFDTERFFASDYTN
jgi:hypothetical protein